MKAGKYSVRELFVNRYLDQIIIPEIQRDYVWKEEQVTGLLKSITSDFKKYINGGTELEGISSSDPLILETFKDFYNKTKHASNIGFIYAYNEPEYPGKYFLIDGQQRLTTIYLLLISLAARNRGRVKEDFEKHYYPNYRLKIDYKVRESAHDFISSFVPFLLNGGIDVQNQRWYFEVYKNDTTIEHLVQNQISIIRFLDSENLDEEVFYSYLSELTEFWYFDTNVSEQGEELYIYMNARGEQIQSNENIKADLLGKLNSEDKDFWGKKWENWQDFFWTYKENNDNADLGFNHFLETIAGLEHYINQTGDKHFYSNQRYYQKNAVDSEGLLAILSIPKIELYIEALRYLNDKIPDVIEAYDYADWVPELKKLIWRLLNNTNTNWFANYGDSDRSTEQNRMVLVWGCLYYLVNSKNENPTEVFRDLRIFYLRYHNNNRSVVGIKKVVDNLLVEHRVPTDEATEEEVLKANYLSQFNGKELLVYESLIWQIEDYPLNLNGADIGSRNISHLVDLSTYPSKDYLDKVSQKFKSIFEGTHPNNANVLRNLLLYYGDYWIYDSPYYYCNMNFKDWPRIIRGAGYIDEQVEGKTAFKRMFDELLEQNLSIEELLAKKEEKEIALNQVESYVEMLIWYSQKLGGKMWSQGGFLASRDWDRLDSCFSDEYAITNTKGNFKGGNPTELYSLLSKEVKAEIKEYKQSQKQANTIPN